jgi:phosphoribosylaminoimidazole (AIR) synthetase
MVIVTAPRDADTVIKSFSRAGEKAIVLGSVIKCSDDEYVVYEGNLNLG